MSRFLFALTLASIWSLASIAQDAPAPKVAGLVGEYFKSDGKDDARPKGKPFLVRVDKAINFAEVSGDFYGSKLSDGFMVRWNGTLTVPTDGSYRFTLGSDDGSRLYIDDSRVLDHWGAHSFTK
ncbi:MAG: beta-glucosidase, partial [Rhodothermales bacterium]